MAELVGPGFRGEGWNEVVQCLGNETGFNFIPGCGALIRITYDDLHTVNGPGGITPQPVYATYRCPCGARTVHQHSRTLVAIGLPNRKTWEATHPL